MVVRDYSVKRSFIGREDELTKLKELYSKAKNSHGQIVTVFGEHGIGKSRLVDEFTKFVESNQGQFLRGRCKRTAGRDPYQPFNEALNLNLPISPNGTYQQTNNDTELEESYPNNPGNSENMDNINSNEDSDTLGGDPSDDNINDPFKNSNGSDSPLRAKPLGLIPVSELPEESNPGFEEELEPGTPTPIHDELLPMGLIPTAFRVTEEGDIKKRRTYLFDEISSHLFKLASNSNSNSNTPVILFIDDIHWSSPASYSYMEYLSGQISEKPIMVIFTVSTDELNEGDEKIQKLNKLLQIFDNLEYHTKITLNRFDIENVSNMIKEIFSRKDVPESLIEQIHQKTEGNPLFIEDVIRALIEEDVIDASSYVWQTRLDVSQIRIPNSTREVLISRLGRLDKNVLKMLGYAAIIGREFTFEVLEELTELPEEQILDAIDTLLEAKLIKEDLSSEKDQYKFTNPIIQNIAYNELSRSRRRFLHTKVGNILENENMNDLIKVVFKLADHFSLGRNYEKAFKYLILAGDRAVQIYAIDDARRYYLTALEMLNKFEYNLKTQQREIELLSNLGYSCKMLGDWDQALEFYMNIPNLVDSLRKTHNDLEKSQKDKFETISENWIQLKLADTYWNLAELMRYKSDWVNSEKNYKKSLLISQEIDDYHGLAQAERGRGDLYWRQGDYKKALDHFDICIDFATKINDLPVISVTYIDIGNIYNYTGEYDQAIAYYKESIEHLEKIGWLHEMGRAYNGLGEAYSKQENWSEAIENFEKCEEISSKIGDSYKRGWALFNAAECYAKMEKLDKAMENCKLAEEILTRLDDRVGLGAVFRNFGLIYQYKKDWAQSKNYYNKSINILKQLNVPFEFGNTYMYYGLMLKDNGEDSEAQKYLNLARGIFEDMDANVIVQKIDGILKKNKGKGKQKKNSK